MSKKTTDTKSSSSRSRQRRAGNEVPEPGVAGVKRNAEAGNGGGEAGARLPVYAELEAFARQHIQSWLQQILEEEVSEVVGRARYERRDASDADATPVYRNGYQKPRKFTTSCGTIEVKRPRVRGLQERFESAVLPLFERRSQTVKDLLPELYLHGLAHGDFDIALRGLLGDDAALSPATIARLKEKWQAEYAAWRERDLSGVEVVYLWVDGVYVKAGLEKEKAALLVALAGLSDGTKMFVAITPGHRESQPAWSDLLRDLKARGMNAPRLVIGDGHLGLWSALRNVFPESDEQRCWNHRIVNVLDRLPKRAQPEAKQLLKEVMYAPTKKLAEKGKRTFAAWCRREGHDAAAVVLDADWERLVAYYSFPEEHWLHLRTTNPIESPFASLRLRTNAAKRYRKVANATACIFQLLLLAEKSFRRLNAAHLLPAVLHGAVFKDGQPVPVNSKKTTAENAA